MNSLSKVSVDLRSRPFMIKRQMAKKKILYILACFSLLTACAATTETIVGSSFDYSKGDLIVKGQTTKQEIMEILGQPSNKSLNESGAEKWIYLL